MSRCECPRELDVLDAVASGRWPDNLSADLSAHVASCALCQDLGLVATTISQDSSNAIAQARIPTGGLVWWRAEIRARQEALRVAGRPISIVSGVVAGCGFMIILALVLLAGPELLPAFSLERLVPDFMSIPWLLTTVAAVVILAFVTLYLVLSER